MSVLGKKKKNALFSMLYFPKKKKKNMQYFQDCDKETRVYYNAYSVLSLNIYFLED